MKTTTSAPNRWKRYSSEEDNTIQQNYDKQQYSELAKKLGRTEVAIKTRLTAVLGLKKKEEWTAEEDKNLVRFVKRGFSYSEIATKLNRTAAAVRQHAIQIGVQKNHQWMDDQKIAWLVKNFKKYSNAQIALQLAVPIYIVKTNLHHHMLRRDGMRVIKRNYA